MPEVGTSDTAGQRQCDRLGPHPRTRHTGPNDDGAHTVEAETDESTRRRDERSLPGEAGVGPPPPAEPLPPSIPSPPPPGAVTNPTPAPPHPHRGIPPAATTTREV